MLNFIWHKPQDQMFACVPWRQQLCEIWPIVIMEPNVWNGEFKSSKLFYRVPHTYTQFSDQYFLCQRKLETYLNINSTYNSCTHVNSSCWMTTSQGALRVSTNYGCTLSSTIPCILRRINFVFITLSFFLFITSSPNLNV